MKTAQLKTLVIDDDAEHLQLLREAAKAKPVNLQIDTFSDGDEALRYLRREESRRPDLVMLDLHLPGKSGFEVLGEIRGDPRLRTLPVMVLSSSADWLSVQRAYSCGANIFFAKPLAFQRYSELVEVIAQLWTKYAELPTAQCN